MKSTSPILHEIHVSRHCHPITLVKFRLSSSTSRFLAVHANLYKQVKFSWNFTFSFKPNMSTAASFIKLSLPFYSFKSSTAKFPITISQRTTKSNKAAEAATLIKLSPWGRRLLAAKSKNQLGEVPPEVPFGTPWEIPSGPNYRPPSVPPEVPVIPVTPEVDPSDTPPEFTTTNDPPPLGRPEPDPGPDFPKLPLGPPPTGPEVPIPPPGRPPPPEVDPPSPPDIVPPPSTPPDYLPPQPPDIPPVPPDIPPPKGPTFVF